MVVQRCTSCATAPSCTLSVIVRYKLQPLLLHISHYINPVKHSTWHLVLSKFANLTICNTTSINIRLYQTSDIFQHRWKARLSTQLMRTTLVQPDWNCLYLQFSCDCLYCGPQYLDVKPRVVTLRHRLKLRYKQWLQQMHTTDPRYQANSRSGYQTDAGRWGCLDVQLHLAVVQVCCLKCPTASVSWALQVPSVNNTQSK